MTEIQEGDCIVVPSLDSNGGKDGFLMARAQISHRKRRRKNCYWYDDQPNKFGYRHVVSVRASDHEPAEFRNVDYDVIAEKLTHAIEPVQRIQNSDLLKDLEALRGGLEEPNQGPLKKFALKKEKQNRKMINAQIAARQGQGVSSQASERLPKEMRDFRLRRGRGARSRAYSSAQPVCSG